MDRKWIALLLLILGAMMASGCAVSKEAMMSYNEAQDLFQKATLAGAKKCAPCQYGTAEAYLALADHEIAEKTSEDHSTHFGMAVKTVKEKSLEAIKICEKPPAPPPLVPPAPASTTSTTSTTSTASTTNTACTSSTTTASTTASSTCTSSTP